MKADFDLDLMRVLVTVVEGQSYAAGARILGVARATVRSRIAELEAHAGVALLRREGDLLVPTDAGAALARGARSLLAEAAMLISEVGGDVVPSGLVRIAMPPGEPPFLMAMGLKAVRARWPQMRLSIIDATHPHELIAEHADLALSLSERAPVGPWEVVDLVQLDLRLYASADWLKRNGTPESVADLARHDLLYWEPPEGGDPTFVSPEGALIRPPVEPAFHSNNIHTLRQMALAGAGLAWFPDGGFGGPGEPPGALKPVLTDQIGTTRWVRLLLPNAYRDVPRARALADAFIGLVRQIRGG